MLLLMLHLHLSYHILFLLQSSHAGTEAILAEHPVDSRLFDDVLIAFFELFVVGVVFGDLAELFPPVVGFLTFWLLGRGCGRGRGGRGGFSLLWWLLLLEDWLILFWFLLFLNDSFFILDWNCSYLFADDLFLLLFDLAHPFLFRPHTLLLFDLLNKFLTHNRLRYHHCCCWLTLFYLLFRFFERINYIGQIFLLLRRIWCCYRRLGLLELWGDLLELSLMTDLLAC